MWSPLPTCPRNTFLLCTVLVPPPPPSSSPTTIPCQLHTVCKLWARGAARGPCELAAQALHGRIRIPQGYHTCVRGSDQDGELVFFWAMHSSYHSMNCVWVGVSPRPCGA
jgi:hypothetical protein